MPSTKPNSPDRHASWVPLSSGALGVLSAIRALLILRIAGPAAIGVWKTAMSIYPLGGLAKLGSSHGFAVLGPVLDGKGERSESQNLKQAAGDASLTGGLAAAAIVFALSFLAPTPELGYALRMVGGVLLLALPMQFLREMASATRRFGILASSNLISGVVDTIAYLGLAYLFGLTGLGMAAAVSTLVPALYLFWTTGFRFSGAFRVEPVKRLIRAGLPAQSSGVLFQMTRRIDLLVLSVFCDPVLVGCYGVGVLVMDFAVLLADTGVSKVVSPRVLAEYGRTGASESTAAVFETALRQIFYLGPPLIAAAALVLPAFVHTLLPEYAAGVRAAELLVWSQLFLCVHACLGGYLAAIGKVGDLIKLLCAILAGGLALQVASAAAGFALEGAAVATLATVAAAAVAELWLAEQSFGRRPVAILRSVAALYWPSVYCFAATAAVLIWIPSEGALDEMTLARLGIVLAAYAPLLTAAERRYGLIRDTLASLPGRTPVAPTEVSP